MRLISRRGNGRLHRVWSSALCTRDPFVYLIPPHTDVVEADGRTWSSPYPVVAFFWPEAYYQVFLLLKAEATEYYCNVISPISYQPVEESIEFTDLDIDVIVSAAGVSVVDMDEFLERAGTYPLNWSTEAILARDYLVGMAEGQRGPFSPATAKWWRAYASYYCRSGFGAK